ncbi:MAG: hypothetical protein PHH59_15115 [Methylovulum sp.]|uniref:hypothetical protein n=1 Tax=Methylovulum sp. TaxID=1916980 RepID=UPI00262F5776|nr:hypothetical protein [Methylovulum sp.]MDD2725335.1 hypothetical protein [Methylovulum sp.]MDD5124840.1 hypothetical protein [Methylovulum sp.]
MNVKSTLFMIIFGVLASSVAVAATEAGAEAGAGAESVAKAPKDPAAFQTLKDQRIAGLQEKLQVIQTHITCAQAAPDHAALKACHETAKQQADALEAKFKAQRAEKKAKHGK